MRTQCGAGAGGPLDRPDQSQQTSNLIWLLSAQLIRVATGAIILDDSTELKGEPGRMVRIGTRIFADRVVRAVQQGGYTTNFPR